MPRHRIHHTTMTYEARAALCQYKKGKNKLTQKELRAWLKKVNSKLSQSAITGSIKRSDKLLNMADSFHLDQKRQRSYIYPQMEEVLQNGFMPIRMASI